MNLYRFSLIICLAIIFSLKVNAYDNIEFHCDQDTTIINNLLKSPELKDQTPEKRVVFFAKKLVGTPSGMRSQILEADTMIFTVDVHSFTPLSFISTCLALAKAYEASSAPDWRDFADKYEKIMFKRGEATDFVSKFLYPSDWISDNIFRGNVTDITNNLDGLAARKKEKSIDYISHHKDNFKAFAKPENLDRIKMLEMGFRNHQIPYISNGDLMNPKRFFPQAQDGDIFFFLTPDFNLDSREMGILYKDADQLMIIQLSPSKDVVTIEELPFQNYIKRNVKRIQGARIIRIAR